MRHFWRARRTGNTKKSIRHRRATPQVCGRLRAVHLTAVSTRPWAEELLAVLNEGIAEISATDGASDLAAKYAIPGAKLPSGALPPPQK
jgi:hypothetical protein